MTASHDKFGNPYLKLSDARPGMTVWLDGGFTCHASGRARLHGKYGPGAWYTCDAGRHYIDGQCDDGGYCIGIYPAEPQTGDTAPEKPPVTEISEAERQLAEARRRVSDLQAANNSMLKRARAAEAMSDDIARALFVSSPSCDYVKGEPIQKTGGDYDADALFVGAFEWEGVVRYIGAIPQKRGHLFFIFNPKQVSPRSIVEAPGDVSDTSVELAFML